MFGPMGMGGGGMFTPQMLQALMAAQQGAGTPLSPGAGSPLGMLAAPRPMPAGGTIPPNMVGAGQPPQQQQGSGGGLGSILGQLSPLLSQIMGGGGGLGVGAAGGLSNLLNGYSFGGIPGQGVLNALSSQAAGNIAGGAAGL